MTRHIRCILFSLLALFLLTLCGCGTETETNNTMTLDHSFSGSRTIDCAASREDLQNRLPDGEASVDFLLGKVCPSFLKWEKSEEGDALRYRFTFSFDSLDDYTRKASELLGREPFIEFSAPNGIFTQGFRLAEDFSASDLLQWLTDAAQEQALIPEGTALFTSGKTEVQYEGQTYSSQEDKISVERFSYLPVDKVTLDTKLKYDGSFTRTVSYQIPQSTCDRLSSELEAYMEGLVPTGGKSEWSALATGRLFTVTFFAEDDHELEEKTAVALDSPASRSTLQREEENIFSKELVFAETADFSSFLSGRHGKTFVEYHFQTDNSAGLAGGQIWSDGGWRDASSYLESDGFSLYGDQNFLRLRIQSDVSYALDALNLHMTKTGDTSYQRDMQFVFNGPGAQTGAKQAAGYFRRQAVPNASVQQQGAACTLTLSGGIPEINAALEAFFGEGNRLFLQMDEGFQLFHKTVIEDDIDLRAFCEQAGFAGEIGYLYTDDTGTNLITRTFSPAEETSFFAEKRWLNRTFAAVLTGFCALLFIVALALLLFLRYKHQEKKPLTRDPSGKALRPLDLVCPYCGARLYSGMDYCTGCGRPVDYLEKEPEKKEET